MHKRFSPVLIALLVSSSAVFAQDSKNAVELKKDDPKKVHWYDNLSVKGYGHLRYNNLYNTNESLKCDQCDKSWGGNGGFFIRRARITTSGMVHPRVFVYTQLDVANAIGAQNQYVQIRDAYVDYYFDKNNQYKIRVGQSKVPFGFDNMQSSQIRLALDRSDAINSGAYNERDLGAFLYYTPKNIKKIYADLAKDNYKGSGDYGVAAFGVYNGQTANRPELNKNRHIVAKLSYPFQVAKQIIEPSISAYTGKYVLPTDLRSSTVKANNSAFEFDDRRVVTGLNIYPKPFGLYAEYNWGKGPRYDISSDSVKVSKLKGGYATLTYRKMMKNEMALMPYFRYQYYDGGKKNELNARSYILHEYELGIEWQLNKYFEFTPAFVISQRRFEDSYLKNNYQEGKLLRLQVQYNF